MCSKSAIAHALAAAFLNGGLKSDQLVERGARALGRRWRWLGPLAQRVSQAFGDRLPRRAISLERFILDDAEFAHALRKHKVRVARLLTEPDAMTPVAPARSWKVPAIRSPGELADWLGIGMGDLSWFADPRAFERKRNQGRLRNYRYRPVAKRFGRIRMIEAPKPRLKAIQRRILAEILERIPPHPAAHGFRRGHSIKTFAARHAGKRIVARLDLEDFFVSIRIARVQAIFRAIGFPETVADLLAGLCTNATPTDAWEDCAARPAGCLNHPMAWKYAQPHLPQGAPTSPALANLCAYRLDCRLTAFATAAGADYTRYADDLAISGEGDFARGVKRFCLRACAIVLDEGFAVHHRKTRVMRHGVRQRLAGLVVNERPNILRADYDRLKAILTNCIRHGAQSQNRSGHEDFFSHLRGRIAFVKSINPKRARRLQELLDQIAW